VSASFSFAVNNVGDPKQETVCLLQNGTQANNPSAKPTRNLNQYYMVKLSIRSGEPLFSALTEGRFLNELSRLYKSLRLREKFAPM
jgi:hypothetical protein